MCMCTHLNRQALNERSEGVLTYASLSVFSSSLSPPTLTVPLYIMQTCIHMQAAELYSSRRRIKKRLPNCDRTVVVVVVGRRCSFIVTDYTASSLAAATTTKTTIITITNTLDLWGL